ncbi:MAG: hypothetical protein WB992_01940 [Bryobacteraceae bacterium]
MKYQVMFGTVPIQCATPSQALALAKEIASSGRARSNVAPQHDGDEGSPLFSAIASLGAGGRRFLNILLQHPEGLSAAKFSVELGFEKPGALEGSISAMKGFLKRRGASFEEAVEESTQDGRFFRIRPRVLNLVRKALEVQ